jgi:hypothetical protein
MAVVDNRHESIRIAPGLFDIDRWRGTAEVGVKPDEVIDRRTAEWALKACRVAVY